MKKFLIFLTVFILSVNIFVPKQVNANPIIKIVAGSTTSKVLKGVAEKAGMKFANSSQYNRFVSHLNTKSSTNPAVNQFLTEFDDAVKKNKPTLESGWKKYLLDPMLWLSGADILFEIYNAFKNGYENSTVVSGEEVVPLSTAFTCADDSRVGGLVLIHVPTGIRTYLYHNPEGQADCKILEISNVESGSNDYYFSGSVLVTLENGNTYPHIFSLVSINKYTESTNGRFYDPANGTMLKMINLTPTQDDIPVFVPVIPEDKTPISMGEPIPINIPDEVNPPIKEDGTTVTDDDPWNDPIDIDDGPVVPGEEPEEDKPAGSSWWKWLIDLILAPINLLVDLFQGLMDIVSNIVTTLIDAILALVVPSDGYFENFFGDTKNIFDSKVPIISQLGDFFGQVKGASVDGEIPQFLIEMPADWGGGEFNIVDFKYFTEYRDLVLNFIRFTMWFVFLKRLYARIPKMLY